MSHKQPDFQAIPSDAKLMVDDWDTLSRLIREIATPQKHRQDTTIDTESLVPDSIIKDALDGPFNPFLACKLNAFAKLCQMRMLVTIFENEALQEAKKNLPLKETDLEKKAKSVTINDLDSRQKKLDDAANNHYAQWRELTQNWIGLIIDNLHKQGVTLSSLEIGDFSQLEPISDLENRFINLQLEPPKNKKGEFDFANYFKHKAYLIIHSSLARRQLPHDQKAVDQVLKKLNSVFSTIKRQAADLEKQQAPETAKIAEF